MNKFMNDDLIKEWDYRLNSLSPYETNGPTRAWWMCLKNNTHGSYQRALNTKPINLGCPLCSGKNTKIGINDFKTFHSKIASEYSSFNEIPLENITVGSSRNILWNCSKNHYWIAAPKTRVKGHNCPYCSNNRILPGFNDFKSRFPKLYDQIDKKKNNMDEISKIIGNSGKKVWWICKEKHSYETSIINRINGSGCPYCSGNKVLKGFNDFSSKYPHQLLEWNWELNYKSPHEYSYGSNKIVYWKCLKGHNWESTVKKKMHGAICPVCEPCYSNFEKIIKDYIESIYDGTILERQRILTNINSKGKLELDIVLPDLGVAIEVQDFATHDRYCNNVHSSYKNLNLTKKGPLYHNLKKSLALEQFNYKVIEIWENEILNGGYIGIINSIMQKPLINDNEKIKY